MEIPGLATTKFPTTGYTSSGALFSSLGTFWTKIFADNEAIKGLSIAQSEELIQRYYEFVEAIASLSVKNVPEFKMERWSPIKIRKSQLRRVPVRLLPASHPDCATLGPQPLPASEAERNNSLHYGETFELGRSKRPAEELFSAPAPEELRGLPLLANRVVAPTRTLVGRADFWVEDGMIYFTKNPFELTDTMKYALFDESGRQITYTAPQELYTYQPASSAEFDDVALASATVEQEEEELILWAYHGAYDTNTLYNSFGYIFDFKEPDAKSYKHVLEKVVNLLVEGPTVQAVASVISAFMGIRAVEAPVEVVMDAYELDGVKYVITDKRAYAADGFYEFSDAVYNHGSSAPKAGARLSGGTALFDAVEYFDKLSSPGWWRDELDRLSLPPYLFLGSYAGALVFENLQGNDAPLLAEVLPSANTVEFPFPPEVLTQDSEAFNLYLNDAARVEAVSAIITDVAAANGGRVNPMEVVFKHFMQANTVMVRLKFKTAAQASRFTKFFNVIRDCLPKYLYLLFYFDFPLNEDTAAFMGNAVDSSAIGHDGSDHEGWVSVPPYFDPPWTVDFGDPAEVTEHRRPFVIARGLDLHTTTTNGYGTFYQNTNGLSGSADIPQDLVDFTDSCKSGADAGNIPMAYQLAGTIDLASGSTTVNGSGTSFLADLSVGDMIYSMGDTNEYRTITGIEEDDVLTIDNEFSGSSRTISLWVAHARPSTRDSSGLIFWRL